MASKGSTSTDRVWEIIETVGIAMLTTSFPGGLRARPVEARPERDAGLIWFVTDLRSGKEHEIEAEHDVGLVFIDAKAKAYLSITARAEVRRDHAKAAEIWKRTDNMWWSGPDDPNVCVLRVRPLTAELWDGPASAAVAAFEFAKARITGAKPNLGENRKVTVRMARADRPAQIRDRPHKNGRARPTGSSGRQSAPASRSFAVIKIVRARCSRTSWATRRPEKKQYSCSRSAARAHSRCRPEATGAASISMASRTFRCAKAPGVVAPGTARRKPASSLSMSTSTCRKR